MSDEGPVRVPAGPLPAPAVRELPAALPLRRMIGPSLILAGLSVGSGEFVLWPRLTAEFGFALFWACWIGVTIQFFLNMEIERWTLATGESAVTGFCRLGRIWGPVFLLCTTLPWIWPGWATGAAQLLSWELGIEADGAVPAIAIASLVLCGLVLSIGKVVYRTVETTMMVLVALIFAVAIVIAFRVVRGEDALALARGAVDIGNIPEGVELPVLLGALAFAGAGGALNLAQSNYIKDKGYGMGHWIGRITSPLTGRAEATGVVGATFAGSEEDLARWRLWWRRTNLEHFFSFFVLCLVSLALFCLIAAALLDPSQPVAEGLGFVRDEAIALRERFGGLTAHVFLIGGVLVLFSTELAVLDGVSRVVADVVSTAFTRESERWSLSRLYYVTLWSLIGFGTVVLLAGFDQPFELIVTSAALNGFVMFLYSGLLLVLGRRFFRGPLRPHPVRQLVLLGAFLFFGWFSVLTLVDRLGGG